MTLSELKVGDKAIVCVGNAPIAIANVTEIAPEGLIEVGGDFYMPDGNINDPIDDDDRRRIQIPDAKCIERIERRELLRKIDGANLRELPVTTLRKIAEALGITG